VIKTKKRGRRSVKRKKKKDGEKEKTVHTRGKERGVCPARGPDRNDRKEGRVLPRKNPDEGTVGTKKKGGGGARRSICVTKRETHQAWCKKKKTAPNRKREI